MLERKTFLKAGSRTPYSTYDADIGVVEPPKRTEKVDEEEAAGCIATVDHNELHWTSSQS